MCYIFNLKQTTLSVFILFDTFFQISSATSDRNFDSMDILGYVTPWNSHGYDVAKTFGPKFSLISPVWLQVVPEGTGEYAIKGTHDVDKVNLILYLTQTSHVGLP